MSAPTTRPALADAGIFSKTYAAATAGTTALVFLSAFESLAVTTVMPVVSADLDGRGPYATAFSATLAASVLGMVAAAGWADRRGPGRPLLAALATFCLGLLGAALAPTMDVFVAARFLQGLGSGGISVTLYVTVALVYPERLRPAVFGVFASAWVLPSLVGPLLAGIIAETFGWPWVFAGVLGLVVAAAALVLPVLLRTGSAGVDPEPLRRSRYLAALVVATAVVVLSSAGVAGRARWVLAALALAALTVAVRPLLPAGTLTARPGVPATVLLRGALAATFFSTEVYLPLMLHERSGLPLWASGAVLTAAALAWASGSAVQGRLGERLAHRTAVRAGTALLLTGVLAQFLTAALDPAPGTAVALAAAGWFVAGGGMGLAYPRTTVLVLASSAPGTEGSGSAALTIADACGGAGALAVTGLLFTAFGALSTGAAFTATLLACSVLAAATVTVALRVKPGR